MELKTATLGKRPAQYPYDRAVILNAGIKVSGDRHEYLVPFNQLLAIHYKHGLVWGELEFILPGEKVVRLHDIEWGETQRFYHHLGAHWRRWSGEMGKIASGVLCQQLDLIATRTEENKWLTRERTSGVQQQIRQTMSVLPLSVSRLEKFGNCHEAWRKCQAWLKDTGSTQLQYNQAYTEAVLTEYADFLRQVESSPLNPTQIRAVVSGEHSLLVLAGTGSGKTLVLVARTGRLLVCGETSPGQVLLLASGRKATEETDERIRERLHTEDIIARTLHTLALYITQQGNKKVPIVNKLENDTIARHKLSIIEWHKQCSEKKAQAKGWRQWLTEEMQWPMPRGNLWSDEKLQRRLAPRLDRWVNLMRIHGGVQTEMIANTPEETHDLFSKRIKLMAPLLKAWRGILRAESAVDFSGFIHQAIVILERSRFISPWKHVLVDEFQSISLQWAALLAALCKQNSQTTLFAVGDDRQTIRRSGDAQIPFTTAFHENFGENDRCDLDTTYHFNSRIGEIANRLIQQNPSQLKKSLNDLTNGGEKAVTLLDESQLSALLDKLSGYAKPEEHILILARYHHMRPTSLEKAVTRWPKLQINSMIVRTSKG